MERIERAIVIKAADYKEYDRLLTLFGACGRFRAVIKGVKKPYAKLKFAAQLFNFGEYSLAERNGFIVVTNCAQIDSFFGLSGDARSYYAAAVASELLHFMISGEDCTDYFTETLKFFTYMREKEGNKDAILAVYLARYINIAGYALAEDDFPTALREAVGLVNEGYGRVVDIEQSDVYKALIAQYERHIKLNIDDVKSISSYLSL